MKKREDFTVEFKREAVRLMEARQNPRRSVGECRVGLSISTTLGQRGRIFTGC
jgi:hypothetical protein